VSSSLVNNGFGLCNGMPGKASSTEALTPWLHKLIQETAGRPNGHPLTFGDLWCPPGETEIPKEPGKEALELKMFSTNLAHGRPYIFPLNEQEIKAHEANAFRADDRLYFIPDELEPYLPADVQKWMVEHARPYVVEPGRTGRDPSREQAKALGLVRVPLPHEFPVLLAARMSLSFPLLFSAVPLWAINDDQPRGSRGFHRCWFSDGGISSNFPMHLFDGLVPRWPTFGITLEPQIKGRCDFYLPKTYREGYGERWNLFDGEGDGIARFGGFLSAIVSAMQNWNDNTLSRMPGVRDRVVRVRLTDDEGGMNLNMERENIQNLARKGKNAAEALLARFSKPSVLGAQAAGWDEHRLVRLNVLLKTIEQRAADVVHALSPDCPYATPIEELVRRAGVSVAAGYIKPLNLDQMRTLNELVCALREQMTTLDRKSKTQHPNPFVTLPKAELRVRPPL